MAAPGTPGALRPVRIQFATRREYQNPKLPRPVQQRARNTFNVAFGLPVYWEVIDHADLPGLNDAHAFAGWSGDGRCEATIAGPGPHVAVFRRNFGLEPQWVDYAPRGLILPNVSQKVLAAILADDPDGLLGMALWHAWELGRSERRWHHGKHPVRDWYWPDEAYDPAMQAALALALKFPDEPALALLKSLSAF